MLRSMPLVCLLLAGCPAEDIFVDPPPEAAPRLESGSYDLVIHGVLSSSCPEMPIAPQVVPVQLAVSGGHARLDLAGLPMSGELERGELFVEWSGGPVVAETEPAEGSEDAPDEPVSDEDDASRPSGGDCGEPEPVTDGADSGSAEPDEDVPPDDRGRGCEDEPELAYAALSASVIEAGVAEGELLIGLGACEVELSITLGPARVVEPEPVPVEEDVAG